MARLIYGMSQSLDGYVGDLAGPLSMPPPDAAFFRHFVGRVQGLAGSLYGRNIYELMRYWEQDDPAWNADQQAFAAAWRANPKWVVSTTLQTVGPNATLLGPDLEAAVRHLKATVEGDIEVGGPTLAGALTRLGLIDVYQLYFRPYVLGGDKPFFTGPRPPLRLVDMERLGDETVLLTYVP